MARLVRIKGADEIPLPGRATIGRGNECTVVLDDPYASGQHAKIAWIGGQWVIRDLGSSNGTFIDGRRLEPGKAVPLSRGCKLGFGEPEPGYELTDDRGPEAVATALDSGEIRAADHGLLAIGDGETPDATLYQNVASEWLLENRDGDTKIVQTGEVVVVGDRAWRLELPGIEEGTPLVSLDFTLDNITIKFAVSQDEERVEIDLDLRGVPKKLAPREHGYILLTMARIRREDSGLPENERGWRTLSEWSKMLRLEINTINVGIHRARQQCASAGLEQAATIVEVGRGVRRFGTDRFEISRLEE